MSHDSGVHLSDTAINDSYTAFAVNKVYTSDHIRSAQSAVVQCREALSDAFLARTVCYGGSEVEASAMGAQRQT
jgi:hypothetical protein